MGGNRIHNRIVKEHGVELGDGCLERPEGLTMPAKRDPRCRCKPGLLDQFASMCEELNKLTVNQSPYGFAGASPAAGINLGAFG